MDDIIFNNRDAKSGGQLNVAIFNIKTLKYDIANFKEAMVDSECSGHDSQIKEPMLTTPHSVSMIDFDGDCMSDLFMTVQNAEGTKKFYEIYIRQEKPSHQSGINSFCLMQYEDISKIKNQQMFEFADIDRDGLIDMIFLTD